ncbi:MAG: cytochrome c biogenesis protein CcsA [Phycisphaeraceae bacterium]|nr:cytochrome c biogenesis protein CcsA [Phycisphaeraceae bacterium]MCW5769661.1 cytochrome c biogenesis protein CcsA [Phycisphaeraceae bacterium]
MRRFVQMLASLRLTVVLLALAMVLIFIGTIAQTQLGVWQAVDEYFRSWIAMADPGLFVPMEDSGFRVPIPGGLTIAGLMIINLLAAHVSRFKATRKRVGVLVLHAGLIVLLTGEFVTGFMADEGLMSIDEGSSRSFLEDIREAELAVIDPSDPGHDTVITVPGWMLAEAARSGSPIVNERLPFKVSVDRWMANSALFHAHGETDATAGIGLEARAEGKPRVTGVEGSQTDTPSAYVTLIDGEREVGTWMVSAALIDAQRVEVGDNIYGLSLRYKRTYLPFTLHLKDFRHDRFTGTNIARNFSSDVRLVDPEHGTDREVRIWMNNPLRYAGMTFYQSSYKPDGSGTVLQVVRNPGWLLPYVACVLVAGGMTWHFGQTLVGFLRRRAKHGPVTAGAPTIEQAGAPSVLQRVWPWTVGLLGIVIACSALIRPMPQSDFDLQTFSNLPVSAGGRIKPLDTAARSMLMVAGGRQQVRTDEGTVPASQYLLDLVTNPERVSGLPILRVDHPDLLAMLNLAPEDGGRIPLSAIEPTWEEIAEQAQMAANVEPRERDQFQRAVLELHRRVNTVLSHAQMRDPFAIPPLSPDGEWRPFHEAFLDDRVSDTPHPSVAFLATMMTAAGQDDAEGFNAALGSYTELLEASMPEVMKRMQLEVLFNRASLFSGATAVYVLAFLGVCASFLLRSRHEAGSSIGQWAERLRVGSLALLIAAVIVHTVAIALRIYLTDRPPVTNLYSSAVFVGWAAALAGVFMERIFPLGVSILGSATIGAGTLIIAHNLGNDGDTMQMMQAVLDSNFWLATHVITITLGYSATFLAGAIASVYLIGRVMTTAVTPDRERAMIRMVYGVVCFALLLSFVGTVLGGIWADQSWGRFWGWDPKENGAALVVLINAIVLHARWGGMIRARGIAALAVGGNIVTAWSWFGTNLLGVGLHAYGFVDSGLFWLTVFVGSQVAVMALAGLRNRGTPKRASE